jgi:SAM-dependent methyltransferase
MADDTIRTAWHNSGQYWDKYASVVTRFFEPITRALVASASIDAGDRVLDLAGGTGDTADAAAAAGANVVCTDISWPMTVAAKRRPESGASRPFDVVQCDGGVLPFPDETFDAVVSRLGVMFFPDPATAIKETLRVLRPGGRAAYAVWGFRDANPFFSVISDVVSRYEPSEPESAVGQGAWRFGSPGDLATLVAASGATDVREIVLEFVIEADLDFDEFWTVRVELSDTHRGKIARIGPELAARAKEDARHACAEYFATGHARFPAVAIVVDFAR